MGDKANSPSESMPLTPEGYRRRKFMIVCRALFYGTLVAIPLKLSRCGENETVEEEKEMVSDLEKRLSTAKDAQGNLVYAKDPMTENYFHKKYPVWGKLQTLNEGERKPVYIRVNGDQLEISENPNGRVMVDVKKHPVRLARIAAEKLIKADKMIFDKEGKHIEIRSSFRTFFQQDDTHESLTGKDPRQVAEVGTSFHEAGLAVDVVNWVDAERYLVRAGLIGGMYTTGTVREVEQKQRDRSTKKVKTIFRNEDANHFSYGELKLDIELVKEDEDGGKMEDGYLNKVWFWLKNTENLTVGKRLIEFDCYNEHLGRPSISYVELSKFERETIKWLKENVLGADWICKQLYER